MRDLRSICGKMTVAKLLVADDTSQISELMDEENPNPDFIPSRFTTNPDGYKVPHDKEQRKVLDTDIKKQLLTREVKRIKLETKDRKKLEKKNAGRGRGYASSWQL